MFDWENLLLDLNPRYWESSNWVNELPIKKWSKKRLLAELNNFISAKNRVAGQYYSGEHHFAQTKETFWEKVEQVLQEFAKKGLKQRLKEKYYLYWEMGDGIW